MDSINHKMTVFFVKMYNEAKELGKTKIPTITIARLILLPLYDSLVEQGAMKPIDLLPEEERQSLVNECRQVEGHNYTNETLTITAKILHLIRTINSHT